MTFEDGTFVFFGPDSYGQASYQKFEGPSITLEYYKKLNEVELKGLAQENSVISYQILK